MAARDRAATARARELCRRLQPILGSQADRIWSAYLAESVTGREQILEYLELLVLRELHGDLRDDGTTLAPPPRSEAAGPYEFGRVTYAGRSLHPFGLREHEWIQHVGIFGRSGAGKTNFGFLVVRELLAHGKPLLVFDWKRNYRDLLSLPGFEAFEVYTLGRNASPLTFNPLIPPAGTPPKTWLKKLIGVVAHAYLLGDGVMYLLQEAFDRAYHAAGVYAGTVETWPTLRDVHDQLRSRAVAGREAGWMSSALRALSALCFGEMDTLLNQGSDDLAGLLERPVILELDALGQSEKVFVTQAILLWIHHHRMAEGTRESFKHAIVIEEAHHVLSGERRSLVGGQSIMDLTFREIREFGESMIILDQHPSQISMPALGNTYCTICFNLKHRTDVNAMGQAMLLDENERAVLGRLRVGEAVARLQGRGTNAFTIAVPEFMITKGAVNDALLRKHMECLGRLRSEPAPQASTAVLPGAGTNQRLALLQDVAAFPDSGIAERYKRLGLSVRRGQRLTAYLLARGVINQHAEQVGQTRRRVVRLTEKGRQALAAAKFSDAA